MTKEFVRIERRSEWCRPYYLSTNTHMYRVNSFVFFNPLTEAIVLTVGQGYLQNSQGIDLQGFNLFQKEIKRKQKVTLSNKEAFIVSQGREAYGMDLLCDLYVPINMLNLKFEQYIKEHNYVYSVYSGDQDIYIKHYEINLATTLMAIAQEFEDVRETLTSYNLRYHFEDYNILSEIDRLKNIAEKFQEERKRIDNLKVEDVITKI